MPSWSIAIVGAGPAGLAAALFLRRDGHRVTVLERFDTPKPLGSGLMLQPTGLAVLQELALSQQIMSLGQRIERLFGRVVPSGRVVLDVRYDALGAAYFGLAVHRAALFGPLFAAAQADGVAIETGCAVTGLDQGAGDRVTVLTQAGTRIGPFDLIVDASGVRSALAPAFGGGARRELAYGALWASLPWPDGAGFDRLALEQRYRRASVMVGVLPTGRRTPGGAREAAFFWSIRPADHAAWQQRGLAAWKDDVSTLWPETAPLLEAIRDPQQLTLARYAHHTVATPVAGRLVAIGDAAHAASPQLGQGANMALLDARALGLALRRPDLGAALGAYVAMRRFHVQFYQALSAAFTPFYQSDSRILPLLRDVVLAPATRLPIARNFVAATVAGTVLDPGAKLMLKREINLNT